MPIWRFADFELDPENQILRKSGAIVKLAPQRFRMAAVSRGDATTPSSPASCVSSARRST